MGKQQNMAQVFESLSLTLETQMEFLVLDLSTGCYSHLRSEPEDRREKKSQTLLNIWGRKEGSLLAESDKNKLATSPGRVQNDSMHKGPVLGLELVLQCSK